MEGGGHNTDLAEEVDNKFASGIHPCSVPKFDLDEQLQDHLRFDSLGESGILLGIQNQSDQWIEEYSRETNNLLVLDPTSQSINFGSSPVESCSISRNGNVWAEAASSESVEMLLTSVGQDEMLSGKNDVPKLDTCENFDRSNTQVITGMCEEDSSINLRNVLSSDSVVSQDGHLLASSILEKDSLEDIAHAESLPKVLSSECTKSGNSSKEDQGLGYDVLLRNLEPSLPVSGTSGTVVLMDAIKDGKDDPVQDTVLQQDKAVLLGSASAATETAGEETSATRIDSSGLGKSGSDPVSETSSMSDKIVYADTSIPGDATNITESVVVKHDSQVTKPKDDPYCKESKSSSKDDLVLVEAIRGDSGDSREGQIGDFPDAIRISEQVISSTPENHKTSSEIETPDSRALLKDAPVYDLHGNAGGACEDQVIPKDGETHVESVPDDHHTEIPASALSVESSDSANHSSVQSLAAGSSIENEQSRIPEIILGAQTSESYKDSFSTKSGQLHKSTGLGTSADCGKGPAVGTTDNTVVMPAGIEKQLEGSSPVCEAGEPVKHNSGFGTVEQVQLGDSESLNQMVDQPSSVQCNMHQVQEDQADQQLVSEAKISNVGTLMKDKGCSDGCTATLHDHVAGKGSTRDEVVLLPSLPTKESNLSGEDLVTKPKDALIDESPSHNATSNSKAVDGNGDGNIHVDKLESTYLGAEVENASGKGQAFAFEVEKTVVSAEVGSPLNWGVQNNEMSGNVLKSYVTTLPVEPLKEVMTKDLTPSGSPKVHSQRKSRATKDGSVGKSRSRSSNISEGSHTAKVKPRKEPSSRKQPVVPVLDSRSVADTPSAAGTTSVGRMRAEGLQRLYFESIFQQHFTDQQQLQLRGQILVYGSLIQEIAPEEAYMVSAFGESSRDGGRSVWESLWRRAVERTQNKTNLPSTPEFSPYVTSGLKFGEATQGGDSLQLKAPAASAGRGANKGSPLAVVNSSVSLTSPMWNIPVARDGLNTGGIGGTRPLFADFRPMHSPTNLYPSAHVGTSAGQHPSWTSQSTGPAPWILSPQTTPLGASTHAETIPVREPAGVLSSGGSFAVNIVSSTPQSVSLGMKDTLKDRTESRNTAKASGGRPSVEQKQRKRRKNLASEDYPHLNSFSQTQVDVVSTGPMRKTGSASLCFAAPTATLSPGSVVDISKATPSNLISTSTTPAPAHFPFMSGVDIEKRAARDVLATNPSMVMPTHFQVVSGIDSEKRVIFSDETSNKIEQAKLQAEDAAALAASAVKHSQGIWREISAQKCSGLVGNVESKLASAAVTAAAAAAVAKAAAAIAKVATDAALQAKLVADNALSFPKLSGNVDNQGKHGSSNTVLEYAKEASKKRVEAASDAKKQAQILDALVKAAELAADAVRQAGAIVVMSDSVPLTIDEILQAGPEELWKCQEASDYPAKIKAAMQKLNMSSEDPGRFVSIEEGTLSPGKELSRQASANQTELVPQNHQESTLQKAVGHRRRAKRKLNSVNTVDSFLSSERESGFASVACESHVAEEFIHGEASEHNVIKLGTLVEVFQDEEGLRAVWFSASVLDVKDERALVCYDHLLSAEGSDNLKEWIPLGIFEGKHPRIRVAHPMTSIKFEGTRKRRRSAMGLYSWSIGDHVDVWMRDGWWEAIIVEKLKEDDTKLIVKFPEGDTQTMRTWNLRPSLIWKDGQWIEWSLLSGSKSSANENDHIGAPKEKRQKLDGNTEPDTQTVRENESLKTLPPRPKPLALQTKDKRFAVGKGDQDGSRPTAARVGRTGLQKEGSRVVFGVPKPGKKKKFMDMSKHYTAESSRKACEPSSNVNFTRYLIPHVQTGSRTSSRDISTGRAVNPRMTRSVQSGKLPGSQRRGRPAKESVSIARVTSSSKANSSDSACPSASGQQEEKSEIGNQTEVASAHVAPKDPDDHVTAGKASSNGGEKSTSNMSNSESLVSDATEPRRSTRKIQPTSRLLEGLQSSSIISKATSVAFHAKSGRSRPVGS